jgi:RNA polymerase sigma-70 factor (ECF subfamily)
MDEQSTTLAIQHYLDELAEGAPTEAGSWRGKPRGVPPHDQIVRALVGRAARRLHQLCAGFLHRNYPRLTRPPLNLRADEVLGSVVERLLRALREARPGTVRQFFALATQHMRWELLGMTQCLDQGPSVAELRDGLIPAPAASDSGLTPDARRMLAAIDDLPEAERESFDLVRIQGLSQAEAARVLGVSVMTVNRRLNRGLKLLTRTLDDLRPDANETTPNNQDPDLN